MKKITIELDDYEVRCLDFIMKHIPTTVKKDGEDREMWFWSPTQNGAPAEQTYESYVKHIYLECAYLYNQGINYALEHADDYVSPEVKQRRLDKYIEKNGDLPPDMTPEQYWDEYHEYGE